jgi:hypothetical protein
VLQVTGGFDSKCRNDDMREREKIEREIERERKTGEVETAQGPTKEGRGSLGIWYDCHLASLSLRDQM